MITKIITADMDDMAYHGYQFNLTSLGKQVVNQLA